MKRKQAKEDDKSVDKHVIMKKRMASLNASAILAASYEADNYTEKQESETNSESESSQAAESSKAESPIKKEKKEVVIEIEEVPLKYIEKYDLWFFN